MVDACPCEADACPCEAEACPGEADANPGEVHVLIPRVDERSDPGEVVDTPQRAEDQPQLEPCVPGVEQKSDPEKVGTCGYSPQDPVVSHHKPAPALPPSPAINPVYAATEPTSPAEKTAQDMTDPHPEGEGIVLTLCDGMGGLAQSLKRDGFNKDIKRIIAMETNPISRR